MKITLRHRDGSTGCFRVKNGGLEGLKEIYERCVEEDDTGWFFEVTEDLKPLPGEYTVIKTKHGPMGCEVVSQNMIRHMDKNDRKIIDSMVQVASFDETSDLYRWLQGEKMEGYEIQNQPNLNQEQAFAVIYILQEGFGFIPDIFEKCDVCGNLYDSDMEGETIFNKNTHKTINCCENCYYESDFDSLEDL